MRCRSDRGLKTLAGCDAIPDFICSLLLVALLLTADDQEPDENQEEDQQQQSAYNRTNYDTHFIGSWKRRQ